LTLLVSGLLTNAQTLDMPDVLTVRERAAVQNRITRLRLDTLLPKMMQETGFDMWIIVCNEDNLDPVFRTMIPYDTWCPITQILVFSRKGNAVERLNLSRTPMRGLHQDVWDYRAWDSEKKESQWDCLKRIVGARNPQRIAINEAETIWAADGLTATLKNKLRKTLGPGLSARMSSAEDLATLWLETLLDEELELYERVCAVAHALIVETFSDRVITPGVTTTDDLLYHYLQRVADLGMERYGWPWFRIRSRDPGILERYGMDDPVIRRGDLLQCDAGIRYLRYYTDHAEWGYVLRPGETEVPGYYQRLLAEANRLQDVFCREFRAGLTGNQILENILKSANAEGICSPKIYSHSIGYYLHEPGPLIGLPWEQVDTGARGDVKLVPNSTFTAELSITCPVPEWNGREMRFSLEEVVAFTSERAYFLDGRQTRIYTVK
jgi:hypothetical protein